MTITSLSIRRPVLTIVFSLIIVLMGALCFHLLPLRSSPFYLSPTLVVITQDEGASAQLIESSITDPLEHALSAVNGVQNMVSRSVSGQSTIELHFSSQSTSQFLIDQSNVIKAVSGVSLPDGVKSPRIYSRGTNNQLMLLGFDDAHMHSVALSQYLNEYVTPQLTALPGIGQVSQMGVRAALRIKLKPLALLANNLTVDDVLDVLKSNNMAYNLGALQGQYQITVNANSAMDSLTRIRNLVVSQNAGHIVTVADVANVGIGQEYYQRGPVLLNGKKAGLLSLSYSELADPISLGLAVQHALKKLEPSFPVGLHVHVLYNMPSYLLRSIHEVYLTIFEAIVLVCLCIFLFLGRWQFTLIPVVTIPVCIIGVFTIMFALGYSINEMTLLSLVLAVGLVVDDAIVVLENCYRHIENGESARHAATTSVNEISFAIIGMTLTLIAVYLPLAFIGGKTGGYFRQFGFTLAGAILISGILALTLSPMMCSRLKVQAVPGKLVTLSNHFFTLVRVAYQTFLSKVLAHGWRVFGIFVVLLLLGFGLFKALPTAELPPYYANLVVVNLSGPSLASAKYMQAQSKTIAQKLRSNPSVESVIEVPQQGDLFMFISLKPSVKSSVLMAHKLEPLVTENPALHGSVIPVNFSRNNVSSSNTSGLQFFILGADSYLRLSHIAKQFAMALQATPTFQYAGSGLNFGSPQYTVSVDQQLAAQWHIPASVILQTMSVALGGVSLANDYQFDGQSYPIWVQLPPRYLHDLNLLNTLYVGNSGVSNGVQTLYPVAPLVKVKLGSTLNQRVHVNQLRAGIVYADMAPGYSIGEGIHTLNQVAKHVLPSGTQLHFVGEARKFLKSQTSLHLIFGLSLLFIYLVLAGLFESFIDPLIILFTVPLSIVGALFALKLIGASINLYSGIALVTLIGLITKHGVLITHFANQLRREGVTLFDAIKRAAFMRLRPILMTTATMVLGALPLVLASGPGAIGREQIGVVIVMGLIVGTFFSLVMVPLVYSILGRFKHFSEN